ncbi:hypothetical protein ONZ45_g16724 [Pleurotus djamor]|nr:hypothetical protein ONZ45_g16724 [Pleurotus djamor]
MKLLSGLEEHSFESWNIAYEVPIKMVDAVDITHWHPFVYDRFKQSLVCGQYTVVKHIILDFDNAEYIGKQSLMPGMWGTPRSDSMDDVNDITSLFRDGASHSEIVNASSNAVHRLETILHFMRLFLHELSRSGHNVIHSTPVVSAPSSPEDMGLTSVTYQIISKELTTISNCAYKSSTPLLIVLGMSQCRPFPGDLNITWGNGWVFPRSHGTLCLSAASFLNARLLTRLAFVNAKTTVVPRFPEENEEEWEVYLTTWDQHRYRRRQPSNWKFLSGTADWLEYGWEHRDEWTYEHEGTRHETSGFSVLCHTKNQLLLPATYRSGIMEIKLEGESVLRVKDMKQERSKKTVAKWSAIIRLVTTPNGLVVSVLAKPCPVFERTQTTGAWTIDTEAMLRKYLPDIVDIEGVLLELKSSLEGFWTWCSAGLATYDLASPVFTKNGDLIVQLRQSAHIYPIPTGHQTGPAVITIPKPAELTGNGHANGNLIVPGMERSISESSAVTLVESETFVEKVEKIAVEIVKAPENVFPVKAGVQISETNGHANGNPLVVS